MTEAHLLHRSAQAPFPPEPLMHRVSGLTSNDDFAQHGRDIFAALEVVSPRPLLDYESILDFGIGSGRLARMFHDFKGSYAGADVDGELVDWVNGALPWVRATATTARKPLPFPDGSFDCVISISVFTHMNEADSEFYLSELHRVTRPGASLMLTVSGKRVVERARWEPRIEHMLAITRHQILAAHSHLATADDGFYFANHQTHLSTASYDYGETFVSEDYIQREWGKRFDVLRIACGAIHDFQDIAVLCRR